MRIINKKARFNYTLFDKFEVGIALTGAETKALKTGRGDLSNSFVKIIKDEAYLINANFPAANESQNYDPTRTRKLLLHRAELTFLTTKMKQKGLTIVPTKVYTKGRLVKLEVALAKSKRKFEKKESIKKKDIEREIEQQLRGRR
jgi:SsrA-binding protein